MKVFEINKDINRYRFGNPISTNAVVVEGAEVPHMGIEYFEAAEGAEISLKYTMDNEDIVLGLGENQRGMNKRGGIYESYCTDEPNQTPGKRSLYAAHNFILVDGGKSFGVFVDFPGRVIFDVGFSHKDILNIRILGSSADIYIIKGDDPKDVAISFMSIIGRPYVPPKWAFGYQQSRWGYSDAKEIEKLSEEFINQGIPCDAIYLDIDYMEDFKDFTVDSVKFPDFKRFVKRMREKGFRLVPIIDAGVKIEEGYDVYEEGVAKGFFCRDENNNPFVAAVWPGKVHFPDFLNPEARRWFGLKYKVLTDCGIEGFWNDMNEPAIFYTDRGLKAAVDKAKAAENENLNIYSYFELMDAFRNLSNNIEDYRAMFHSFDGKMIRHDEVHNLYGAYMTIAAAHGLQELLPDKRFLLFSRASYIGMHRYAGIWTGDNHSWWEHLLLSIKMMPSINMCGFLYSGADTGGFGGDVNSELLIRWTQFSLFTPLFRNHSAMGTRRQEPFAFEDAATGILRNMIKLRYALLPHLYSEYMKAARKGALYFMPLSFDYRDEASRRTEDQLLLGDSLMLCPIYAENARGRYAWLPEDMLLWKAEEYDGRKYQIIGKGHSYINVSIGEVPIFLRKNRMLVLGKPAENVERMKNDEFSVIAFVDSKAEYVLYEDDGETYGFDRGLFSEIKIFVEKNTDRYDISVEKHGNRAPVILNFEIVDSKGNITKIRKALD